MTILGYFTRPESQGEIRLASADPDARPIINANHFSAEIDRISAVSLFKWLRALGKQDALKDWIVEETLPGSRIETDEDILANAVQLSGTSFHICATIRIGPDSTSVVDPSLRVRGVVGLPFVVPSTLHTNDSGKN